MECLDNIVGLSKNGCDCIDLGVGEDSLSGLYLDDSNMGRLPLSASIFDCSDNDVVSFLGRLIPDSVKELNGLLYMEMEKNLVSNYRTYNFKAPKKESYSTLLAATAGYYFMAIKPKTVRGTILTLKTISVPVTTGDILLIDEFGTTLYEGIQTAFEETDLVLDREYYIAYQSATRPKDYKYKCCGQVPQWNNFIYLGGGIVTDLADLEYLPSEYSHGVIITGVAKCDSFAPLCDVDFENDPWGHSYAMAVLYIGRKNLAAWLLSSGQITNYITTNGEEIPALIDYCLREIEKRVKFLPQAYNLTDCYQCGYLSKGEILI